MRSERLNTRVRKTTEAATRDYGSVPAVNRLADLVVEQIPEYEAV